MVNKVKNKPAVCNLGRLQRLAITTQALTRAPMVVVEEFLDLPPLVQNKCADKRVYIMTDSQVIIKVVKR